MFDILVYVLENYLPDARPEPDALARKLTAAGFDEDEISEALDWLDGLEQAQGEAEWAQPAAPGASRIYDEVEMARLSADCRGFLAFLEQAGAVDDQLREMIVERAVAVGDAPVSLSRFKVIVLMVMWRQQLPLDSLIYEELLADDDEDRLLH